MRILLQTSDREAERNYCRAAEALNRQRLCVLRSEAQVLERLFRDPFDLLIVDDAESQRTWLRSISQTRCGGIVLLYRNRILTERMPESIVYAFPRTADPSEVLRRIDSFQMTRQCRDSLKTVISRNLQRIGVPVHLRGFFLLREAIRVLLTIDRPTEVRLVEDIYAALAKSIQSNPYVVEHAMRHAIETAWLRADVSDIEALFGDTISSERAVPSNAGFLYVLTDRIKADRGGNRQ